MLQYMNPNVVLRYDFIVTYPAIMFFIHWILATRRLKRFRHDLWRVWESRNRLIHRGRRASEAKKPPRNSGR
jgi:hypothetical protein